MRADERLRGGQPFDERTRVLLDVECESLDDVMDAVGEEFETGFELSDKQRQKVDKTLRRHGDIGVDALKHGVALVHERLRGIDIPDMAAIVRTTTPLELSDEEEDKAPARFVVVLLSNKPTHPLTSIAAEFTHLMRRATFQTAAESAANRDELIAEYEKALEEALRFEHIPEELQRTGRLFGGVARDLGRRLPLWMGDWTDGFNTKVVASTLFMFFACLAPAVAFGGLLSTLTGGQIGAIETVLASVVCGLLWSVFAGQPLAIVGATGPNVIFIGILFGMCERFNAPFLPTLAWTGLWAGLFMIILAALDASALIRFFTRFSDEIFAALIAMIFISEAAKDLVRLFTDGHTPHDTALLSLLLALGTFGLAISMSRFRRSPYLRPRVREFLSDFGPAIALVTFSLIGWSMHAVELETLAVPETFAPTIEREWFVNPMDAPTWVIAATPIPAVLLTILIWTNQNITARLANSPDYKMKKGPAFHYDIVVMGFLVALMGLFGLPWVVGAVVRSLNHVKSLVVEKDGKVVGVVEQRLSNFVVHILLGIALLLFLPLLGVVPMPVLFGMFIFMGVGTLGGNQFVKRMELWILDPEQYSPTHYLRAVPSKRVHLFTAVQAGCLTVLWLVKASIIGILFPFFLALLVPVRMMMGRFFAAEHLALLDAEEVPADEADREVGV
ncbi:MAG: HCO3- transporter [Sandaracinaceae bacterium]